MEPLFSVELAEHLEDAAVDLADGNACESAWFLRGATDALMGREPQDTGGGHLYRRHYDAGYTSIINAREKVGV